jgi:CP family cyanate transporter-like MFS transporter
VQRQPVVAFGLLWLTGACLRLTILAVPPVLPLIRAELHLLGTEIGILNGIPLALFALAAVPGSLLIGRFGTSRTLIVGLLATAIGGALRAVSPGLAALYAATVVMGFGVAIMQPLLAALVREWLPRRIGLATAVYTNGLLIGEIFPVFLTLPLVLPWLGGAWRLSLGFWSLPVGAVAVLALATVKYAPPARAAALPARRPWWPDWSDSLVWQLGMLLGTINAMYFGANAFLPPLLASRGESAWVGPALTALNVGQLPASFLLLRYAGRLERRMWPYLAVAALDLAGVAGIVFGSGPWLPVWTGIFGFAGAAGLIFGLTLPPLLSDPAHVARTSAAMFTLSYGGAVVVAVLSGAAWDLTGLPAMAFAPIALCGVTLVGAALLMRAHGRLV